MVSSDPNPAGEPSGIPPVRGLGSGHEFVALFLAHQRVLFRQIVLLVQNVADAEDLLQETASTLWLKFDQFSPGTSFYAWAHQIAVYKVQEYRRKKLREPLLDEDVIAQFSADSSLEQPSSASERAEALEGCLQKLSAADRSLIEKPLPTGCKPRSDRRRSGAECQRRE